MTGSGDASARLALAYDDLYAAVERDPALFEHLRRHLPVGLRDQADAAVDELHSRTAAVAERFGCEITRGHDNIPDWVRLGALAALAAWTLGESDTCMHMPRADRPQPVAAAAWRPGLIICGRCEHLIRLRPGSEDDRRCDCCGRVTDLALGPDNGIVPAVVVVGPLTYVFGMCGDCAPGGEPW